jgi:rSAM/selenodomain-associated transferase 1
MEYQLPEFERALLVFVRYPEPGQVLTRLAESVGGEMACRIYDGLARQTLDEASRVADAARYVFYDPPECADEMDAWLRPHGDAFALAAQGDGDPGERIHAALHRVFSRNSVRRAVVIASDCPGLTVSVIEAAFRALDQARAVLGPSSSGDCYLFGLTDPMPFLFEQIEWSKGGVFEQALEILRRCNIEPVSLAPLRQVLVSEDLDLAWPGWRGELGA